MSNMVAGCMAAFFEKYDIKISFEPVQCLVRYEAGDLDLKECLCAKYKYNDDVLQIMVLIGRNRAP